MGSGVMMVGQQAYNLSVNKYSMVGGACFLVIHHTCF